MSFDFCALCINMNTKIWYVFIKICFVCMTLKKKYFAIGWEEFMQRAAIRVKVKELPMQDFTTSSQTNDKEGKAEGTCHAKPLCQRRKTF